MLPQAIGIDSCKDTELFGIAMTPDIVAECDCLPMIADESKDYVFSSHTIEHIAAPKVALAEWFRCLKVGGYLTLYFPDPQQYPRVGTPGANPDHVADYEPEDMIAMMEEVGSWDLVENQRRSETNEYSILQVFRKLDTGEHLQSWKDKPKHAKTACVVRYGGQGDSIQVSGICAELHRQGYWVVFMTTPRGEEILRHDPNIAEFFIQDDGQVPNGNLHQYWEYWSRRFHKFVQLSESIEGTLLALPGRANHQWPHAVRARELNKNYLEWTAQLAELPYRSESKFYPSHEEKEWVADYLNAPVVDALKGQPFGTRAPRLFHIVWVLSGSSIHKFYPWADSVIARILTDIPEARLTLVGDHACVLLEQGWENEPRIRLQSGKLSVRETMVLAQYAQLVIGPETGVLNAVAFEPNAKIVFLSHSSIENLTLHWVNTASLSAPSDEVPCSPCHQLHYSRDYCPEHKETGASMCQAAITPERAWDAVDNAYRNWKTVDRLMREAA